MVSTSSKKRKVVGFSLYAPDPVKEDEELAMLGLANEMKDGFPPPPPRRRSHGYNISVQANDDS